MRSARPGRDWTRRAILFAAASAGYGESRGEGELFPSEVKRYLDAATEFPVYRLTDPAHTSVLPPIWARAASRRNTFLLHSSDRGGDMQVYRLDLKTGESRKLTGAAKLDTGSPTLSSDERTFFHFDGDTLYQTRLANLRTREVHRVTEGYTRAPGFSVSEDNLYAAVVERKGSVFRLRLVSIAKQTAITLAESDEEIREPIPRPKRASVLYRRGENGLYLVNYDAQQNYRFRLEPGGVAEALWSPDGRSVLYLNLPEDRHRLHNLREFTPDTNADEMLTVTSQFVVFDRNGDASVFVGASGSKASPYVLLLIRAVKRELTLCEHRASDARRVQPIFSPDSQRIYFQSDQHGKPALYFVAVDRFVARTES